MADATNRGTGPSAGAGRGGNFATRGGGPKNFRARRRREGAMTPNRVTAARVAAAFAAVGLFTFFGNALAADIAAVALTIAAIALDGVDGYLARRRGMATPLGAQLDILGDRVVENLFFTFFAVAGAGAGDLAWEPRSLCDFEVRVFLLSGIASAGGTLAHELVGR